MNAGLGSILLSLFFSALFSGAEIAFKSSNKLYFELDKKEKNLILLIIAFFYRNSRSLVTTLLIGKYISIVICVMLIVGYCNPLLYEIIPSFFAIILIQTLAATLIILFLGEFLPKVIIRIFPNVSLSVFSIPIFILYIILYPVTKITFFISWLILKVFGVDVSFDITNKALGRDELDSFIQKTIEESPENAELDKEVRLFQNALDFSHVKLRDCIVPRTEIVALDLNASVEDLLAIFIETGLSKILIYKDDIDNVIGYIHSSEMFTKPNDWTKKINPLPIVPENMAANKLMKNLLEEKKSIAVVVDEFGGTAGIVTMEDLVEEIFGEIEDEHDMKSHVAKKISENEFILSGRMDIDVVNETFNLNIPESDEYMTISGYILNKHQNFPKLNETISIGDYTFKIIKMTTTKIELVRLRIDK